MLHSLEHRSRLSKAVHWIWCHFLLPSWGYKNYFKLMDNLPFEIIERFHRAFDVIQSERELAHKRGSRYDRWFGEVDQIMVNLVEEWSKVYAEDPDSEYAQAVQQEIQACESSYWGDRLWELITGRYYDGDDMDLELFVISMVVGHHKIMLGPVLCADFAIPRCT